MQKPLRILFISRDCFPPFRVDVAVLFGKELIKRGFRIDWVLQSEKRCKRAYINEGQAGRTWVGRTHTGSKMIQRALKHIYGFTHKLRCTNLIARQRYDIVQVKDHFFTAVAYLLAAKLFNVPFFYWLSYPFAEASLYESRTGSARYPFIYLIRGTIYKILLYKLILKYADHAFIQSEQMKLDIQREGIPGAKLTEIPMGFEPESFSLGELPESKENATNKKRTYRIIYLGTLIRLRKIDFIIRVFAMVHKKLPESVLMLVGRGETEEDILFLKEAARTLDVSDAVVFTGFLERQSALQIVDSADVCLSPFYPTPVLNSTSPTKMIEYMALGKTVVANDHPEQKRVLEESGGGICVSYDEKEFAQAVIQVLTHPADNEAMGIKGKRWVYQNRTYPIIADRVEKIYRDFVQNEMP